MLDRRCRFAIVLASLALAAAAQTLVAPVGLTSVEGNNNAGYPWNTDTQGMRIQFVYDSSNFTLQGVTTPVLIQRLRFRPDATTATWPGGSWPNVRIDMATCTTDYLTASATFAANVGSDMVTAYQGQVVVQGGTGIGLGVAQPWHIDILLTTPFVYDPNAGDLVFDVQLDGTGWMGSSCQADAVMSLTTNPALGTQVFSTGGPTATSGTVAAGFVIVCEFGYGPANSLLAAFSATPTTGTSPLLVQFSDHSHTSSPAGITAWAWDFDGDGITDSTQANPAFTYTGCGDFTVSLTVQDGVHPPSTRTLPQHVHTDRITAAFTATALGGGNWQCLDATTPPATSWAWDFDDDGVVDSTLQNPIADLGTTCNSLIRLVATRNCRTSTATMPVLQAPGVQMTTLSAGTGTTSSATVGNLFDLQVLPYDGVSVCGLTTATHFGTGPYDIDVYVTPGSYVGNDTNASVWRHVAHGRGVMAGGTVLSPVIAQIALDQPFYLPPGDYGVAIWHTVPYGWAYMSFSLAANGPYAGGDLVFHPSPATAPGMARTGLFGGYATTPRQWNGAFHYTRAAWNNQAGYGVFALGCQGSGGVPGNVVQRPPSIGRTMQVDLTNLPQNLALYWWGFSNTMSTAGPLPLDLSLIGAPGCQAHVSFDAAIVLTGTAGTATFQFALPNAPSLLGAQFYTQGLALDPPSNVLGFVASDAAGFVVGQ